MAQPVSAQPTGQSWYAEESEVWKPKKAAKLSRRPGAPSRPPPAPPVEIISAPPPQGIPAGILITEPAQKFARVRGPKKSSMKTPAPVVPTGPSPLPATAYLSPDMADQRRQVLRQTPSAVLSPPSSVGNMNWMSPAPSHSRFSSTAGSSTGTSSVAFTSSSFYSSSQPRSTSRRAEDEDEDQVQLSAPRQTLFVVNADPDSSESGSPVDELRRHQFPPVGQKNVLHRGGMPRPVPPVPTIPPQFRAPPPPAFPPPGDRSRSDPAVPGLPKPGSERDR